MSDSKSTPKRKKISLGLLKGKTASTSVPSISIRYNAEDDELEELCESSVSDKSSDIVEEPSTEPSPSSEPTPLSKKSSPLISKFSKRSGSLEETSSNDKEPWRIFTEIKGRLTKRVEEIKNEKGKKNAHQKKEKKDKKSKSKGEDLSDSEEASVSYHETSSPDKSLNEKLSQKEKDKMDTDPGEMSENLSNDSTEVGHLSSSDSDEDSRYLPQTGKCKFWPSTSAFMDTRRIHIEVGEEVFESVGAEQRPSSPGPGYRKYPAPQPISTSISGISALDDILNEWQPWLATIITMGFAIIYVAYPIPPFLAGLVSGMYLCVFVFFLYRKYFGVNEEEETMPKISGVPILKPPPKAKEIDESKIEHEVWVNLLSGTYDPEKYHLALTQTVLLRIRGGLLQLLTPLERVPKRAFWSEKLSSFTFIKERRFCITNCKVLLLPVGLVHKRQWSKKYPVAIQLSPESELPPSEDFILPELTEEQKKKLKNEEMDASEISISSTLTEDLTDDYEEFYEVPTEENHLFLFFRSCREKEIWYRKLVSAVGYECIVDGNPVVPVNPEMIAKEKVRNEEKEKYHEFIYGITSISGKRPVRLFHKKKDYWFTIIMGRILYDVCQNPITLSLIEDKIQKKLAKIKIPSYVNELTVSRLEFLNSSPVIEKSYLPSINEHGVWVTLDISYRGSMKIIIETKLNLVKGSEEFEGKKDSKRDSTYIMTNEEIKTYFPNFEAEEVPAGTANTSQSPKKSGKIIPATTSKPHIYDSSLEDSFESSSDDETLVKSSKAKKKETVFELMDKVANSRYFQHMTENKFVKRALKNVSKKHLALILEVKGLVGTFVINIPAPPSDRIWVGFKKKPKLCVSVQPAFGDIVFSTTLITNYLEKKFIEIFDRTLVLPNMEDIVLPVMIPDVPS